MKEEIHGAHRTKIALVILAAGNSTRMGAYTKLLLPWKDRVLIQHVVKQAIKSNIEAVFVVLGANYEKILKKIKEYPVSVLKNDEWQTGMGSSLKKAVEFIEKKDSFDAVLIMLADQPLIEYPEINMLIDAYKNTKKEIVACKNGDKLGVPAIISIKYFKEIQALKDDFGARKIIQANLHDTESIDLGNKTADIDTLADYNKLFEKYGK